MKGNKVLILRIVLGLICLVVCAGAVVWVVYYSTPDAKGLPVKLSIVDGQEVLAGDTVKLEIIPPLGLGVTDVQIWSPLGSYIQHNGNSINIAIPNDKLGPATMSIYWTLYGFFGGSAKRTVQVITSAKLNEIRFDPRVMTMAAPGISSYSGLAENRFSIVGMYSDGVLRDISEASGIVIKSDNPEVATVSNIGTVKAVAPGQTTVTAIYDSIASSGRVQVNVFERTGDLDGDGDVDQNDLDIITKALNTKASGPGDPRDLNYDQKINMEDYKILAVMCSREKCATK